MDRLRLLGDELADKAVLDLLKQPQWAELINSLENLPSESVISDMPFALASYFRFFQQSPSFLNETKVMRSQEFFSREGSLYLAMLGFYSLPYCYAFADGAQVLVRSKRIMDDIGRRLSETALFVLDMFDQGTFLTNDKPLLTLAKVRLIHAFSRYFVKLHSKDWDVSWGTPINQEDMIGTNLAFSLMVFRGLEKMDRFQGKETLEDLLHYWKVAGHYLGLLVDLWPETAKEAIELERLIRKRHLGASDAGKALMASLGAYYKKTAPSPLFASNIQTIVAYFIGKDAALALGLEVAPQLPKILLGAVMEYQLYKESKGRRGYTSIRSQFKERTMAEFGVEISLNIPVLKRP